MGRPAAVVKIKSWLGRALLALVGLSLVGYLVHEAGPGRVAGVFLQAGRLLPIIAGLELLQTASDVFGVRLLLGREAARNIPRSAWVRSSAVAYAMMILLPAGRAAGEVARATLIAKHVGTPVAANASVGLSVAYLFAIGFASCAAFVVTGSWLGFGAPLALLLAGNTLVATGSSAILFATSRNSRVAMWIDGLRRRFVHAGDRVSHGPRARVVLPWRTALVCAGGRFAQLIQYGIILTAVGGVATVRATFVTHGIHLVGATLGDLLPNQLGVVDGTYRAFAPALGLGGAPARALSIAFVAHAVQLSLATLCVVVAALTRPRETPEGESAPVRAGVRS